MQDSRKAFLQMKAPEGYVAGVGRGATGFMSRSDIGSAKATPSIETLHDVIERNSQAHQEPMNSNLRANKSGDAEDEERISGRIIDNEDDIGLFAGLPFDAEDEEAERIYQSIDDKMSLRRKKQREIQEQLAEERAKREGTKIQRQFADVKSALSTVTDEEWTNLPEIGNLTKRRKIKEARNERSYAVSDTFVAQAQNQLQYDTTIEDGIGTQTNIDALSAARDKMLSAKLDQIGGSNSSIDVKAYVSGLQSTIPSLGVDIADIRKARLLLNSVVNSNPTYAPGWISAARLEELAAKPKQARNLIKQGCQQCPHDEDVWLENIRLHSAQDSMMVASEAVKLNPNSEVLWTKISELEPVTDKRKTLLRKALEFNPHSLKLWKEAINLEEDVADVKLLLKYAIEINPGFTELWIALSKLEDYDDAKVILDEARKAAKNSIEVWIAASELEEQHKYFDKVYALIKRAITELSETGEQTSRETWIEEAIKAEISNHTVTAAAITKESIGLGLIDEDKQSIWLGDIENFKTHNAMHCARAAFALLLETFPSEYHLWRKACDFEKSSKNSSALYRILEQALAVMPDNEIFWLIYAKEKYTEKNFKEARSILSEAARQIPESEQIWLAAIKLEWDMHDIKTAKTLMNKAKEVIGSERIWVRSVTLERQIGSNREALIQVNKALSIYMDNAKLHLQKGQILQDLNQADEAKKAFALGSKMCPKSVALWIQLARCEATILKARAVLERALIHNQDSEILWHVHFNLELKENLSQARRILAKGMQKCPDSGLLWSDLISVEPRAQKRQKAIDALKMTNHSPHILITIAKLFLSEKKVEKARDWYQKATKADPDFGDAWVWYYSFSKEHDNEEQQNLIKLAFNDANPRHGILWPIVRKAISNSSKSLDEILELATEQFPSVELI